MINGNFNNTGLRGRGGLAPLGWARSRFQTRRQFPSPSFLSLLNGQCLSGCVFNAAIRGCLVIPSGLSGETPVLLSPVNLPPSHWSLSHNPGFWLADILPWSWYHLRSGGGEQRWQRRVSLLSDSILLMTHKHKILPSSVIWDTGWIEKLRIHWNIESQNSQHWWEYEECRDC